MGLLNKPVKKKLAPRGWKTAGFGGSPERPLQVEKTAPCAASCPIHTDLRRASSIVAQREKLGLSEEQALDAAWRRVTATNPFPATLGRICPHPCEEQCNRGRKDGAVALGELERFLGDWGIARNLELQRLASGPSGKAVAVVGAGPGGLACAANLARRGHAVTVYESSPRPGGMLLYGVPPHRLSRAVLNAEIGRLVRLDIRIECDRQIGGDLSVDDLRRTFDAVFVAIGAHRGRPLGLPGGQGADILSGVEFLRHAHAEPHLECGPRVVVLGDGRTAIDVARVANRLGRTRSVSITLLRAHSQEENDLSDLTAEGIAVAYETTPVAVIRNQAGRIVEVWAQAARLGEPDSNGVRWPIPLPGPTAVHAADTVIAAVGQTPDWESLLGGADQLRTDAWGRTGMDRVWSGGDNLGLDIAARSISQGARAALSIDAHLAGRPPVEHPHPKPVASERVKLDSYDPCPRATPHRLAPAQTLVIPAELEQGLTREQAVAEASRCLSCGTCSGCERCWMYCTPGCFSRREPAAGEPYFTVSLATCDGCRKCADLCPTGFIEII